MNFLAHLYLSGNNPEVRLGNFIGDHVKGSKFTHYPPEIQKGIKLHRAIDSVTDSHPSTRACSSIFKPAYKRYSGVVCDVVFDHVLAREWSHYSSSNLNEFTQIFYTQMLQRYQLLPSSVQQFLPNMIRTNRLSSYQTSEGVREALDIMSFRTSLPNNTEYAIEQLRNHYSQFFDYFHSLFGDLIQLATVEFGINL
jgi:acyl carrier protein phosphodiesterase